MTPPPDGAVPTVKQRAALAARLRSAIEGSSAHWKAVPDLDFDAAFETYLDKALAAELIDVIRRQNNGYCLISPH